MPSRAGPGDFLMGIFKKALRAGGHSKQEGGNHERACGGFRRPPSIAFPALGPGAETETTCA